MEASSSSGEGAVASLRPDVVIVAVDGISPGHIRLYGGGPAETPAWDRLCAEGATYIDTLAPSPWPDEALAALLTGRVSQVADGEPWTPCLADLLGHDGYRTGLILAHGRHVPKLLPSPLRAVEASAKESEDPLGALSAFDFVRMAPGAEEIPGARADTVAQEAVDWLGQAAGPALLVVTLGDPRPPHHLYRGLVPAADVGYDGPMKAGLSHSELLRLRDEFTEEDRLRLLELHATEVAMAEAAFSRIAGAAVARRETPPVLVLAGLRAPALGQAAPLGIRGDESARYGLVPSFEPHALRVPLVIRFPRPLGDSPREVDARWNDLRGEITQPTSLIDVMPTLLDALGLDPRYDLDGRSVFPGARAPSRGLVAMTRRGLPGGALLRGDRYLSMTLAPESEQFFGRANVDEPFTRVDPKTSADLDQKRAMEEELRALLARPVVADGDKGRVR